MSLTASIQERTSNLRLLVHHLKVEQVKLNQEVKDIIAAVEAGRVALRAAIDNAGQVLARFR